MECRAGCGACCIAPSISSASPKHPNGKPKGLRCLHLTNSNMCDIFDSPLRPAVCGGFKAELEFCGTCYDEAIRILSELES